MMDNIDFKIRHCELETIDGFSQKKHNLGD
jgi:hypothetical protein